MFEKLAQLDVAWSEVVVYQVDERIAPAGDATRNLTNLERSLGASRPTIVAMPVNDEDLDEAAADYARLLPERFDLVHLGLGPDGHTASLIPGDPVLEVRDHLVAVTGVYQGEQRMTLTYDALSRADQLLWLVTGSDKRAAAGGVVAWRHVDPGRFGGSAFVTGDGRPGGAGLMSVEEEKRLAAETAAERIEPDSRVGLGTGTTVAYLLEAIARRGVRARYVATSPRTEESARSLGLIVEPFDALDELDLAIDGADQIAPDGWLVKGRGGAHLREKIVGRRRAALRGHRRLLEAGHVTTRTGAAGASSLRTCGHPSRARRRGAPGRRAHTGRRRAGRLPRGGRQSPRARRTLRLHARRECPRALRARLGE